MKNTLFCYFAILVTLMTVCSACDETQKMMKPVLTPIAQEPGAQSEAPLAEQPPLRPDESQPLLTPVTEEPETPIKDPFPEKEIHTETVADRSLYVFYTAEELTKIRATSLNNLNYGKFYYGTQAGVPSTLFAALWLLDPETVCHIDDGLNDHFTDNPRFFKPYSLTTFKWDTGEFFVSDKPLYKGDPPRPLAAGFASRGRGDGPDPGYCPLRFFYISVAIMPLDQLDQLDLELETLTPDMIGISIELENGEVLTWQLSEIYDEIPPPPSKRER